jgi:hypothetical protein
MTVEQALVRKSLPMSVSDLEAVALIQGSEHHRAVLMDLSWQPLGPDSSEARYLRALLAAGIAAVRERVESEGYATIAAGQDPDLSRRAARRRQPSWAHE